MRSRRKRAAIGGCALVALGCATSIGASGSEASVLVGEWVDVAKTTPRDSMIWVLRADGDDRLLRLRIVKSTAGEDSVSRTEGHHARWHLDGALSDTAGRALCFAVRPGRQPASCSAFRLDTVDLSGASHRRIVLLNYVGSHSRLDRVLVERAAGARAPAAPPGR